MDYLTNRVEEAVSLGGEKPAATTKSVLHKQVGTVECETTQKWKNSGLFWEVFGGKYRNLFFFFLLRSQMRADQSRVSVETFVGFGVFPPLLFSLSAPCLCLTWPFILSSSQIRYPSATGNYISVFLCLAKGFLSSHLMNRCDCQVCNYFSKFQKAIRSLLSFFHQWQHRMDGWHFCFMCANSDYSNYF